MPDVESSFLVCGYISRYMGQVHIWRSLGQGQGHKGKKLCLLEMQVWVIFETD